MTTESGKKQASKGRKSRWYKDKNGKYHYSGICPFNNSVCKLRNYFAERRSELPQGVDQ